MEKWKTLSSEYIYKSKFGNLRTDKCLLPNGIIIDEYHVNEYADWVNCVAITANNEIILVKQYRQGAKKIFFEIPAGALENKEAPVSAIIRELEEETGYVSTSEPIFISTLYTNPATNNNCIHTYLVTGLVNKSNVKFDTTEDIETILVPMDKIEEMIQEGRISQLFTVCAIEMVKSYLQNRKIMN